MKTVNTPSVSPERFAEGRTFDEYLAFIASPENLRRESNAGPRRDWSTMLRASFEQRQLTADQLAALQWLVAQPGGPANMLVLSEEWSSDCRRDVPTFARMAAETGMELRIFNRDGQHFSSAHVPDLTDAPDSNADLMAQFLNQKDGQTWQSIPVCAFFSRDFQYLYHFTEYPAIYQKDRLVSEYIRAARPGETPAQAQERGDREFAAFRESPFFRIWTSAAVDEIVSALQRRLLLGVA